MQILCATDFSEAALQAADAAAALAKNRNLPLRLIHCTGNWAVQAEPMLDGNLTTAFQAQLDAEAERLRATGIEVNCELRSGDPAAELIAAASDHPTRLLVIGATGSGRGGRWLPGRVAERVAAGAPVPVLAVREAGTLLSWLNGGNALHVLCGVDFNRSSDAALNFLKGLQSVGRIELEAAHILSEAVGAAAGDTSSPESPGSPAEVDAGERVFARVNAVFGEPPVRIHLPDTSGSPDEDLARLSVGRGAGLLVVGTHQRHGWHRFTRQSFCCGVLAHAATNVLCVPIGFSPPDYSIPRFRRIVVAVDPLEPSPAPLRCALGLLHGSGDIRLLHIIAAPGAGINPLLRSVTYLENSMVADKARVAAQEALLEMSGKFEGLEGIRITAQAVIHEDTAEAICSAADSFGADLICMGGHNRSRVVAALAGSTVQSVTARSHCPVMVIPAAAD